MPVFRFQFMSPLNNLYQYIALYLLIILIYYHVFINFLNYSIVFYNLSIVLPGDAHNSSACSNITKLLFSPGERYVQ